MAALITFAVAIALCALIVLFGPGLAEQAGGLLGEAGQENYPALETIAVIVIYGGLLLFALVGASISRVNPLRLGRRPLRMAAVGAAFGLCGLGAAAAYALVAGALGDGESAPTGPGLLLWGSLLILFMAAAEEIYFRGWVQPVLSARYGAAAGVLLSALAFAALHLMGGARSPTSIINLFLGGLLFGLLALRGGGIAAAVAAHFTWNWSEQIVLGLDPNPGVGTFGAIVNYDLSGAALWGGSDEGLNASIAMTIALLALVIPLIILARATPRSGAGAPVLAEARPGAVKA